MSRIKSLVTISIVTITLLFSVIPSFAFSANESRSVESFFIEAQLLKGDGSGYGLDKAPTRMEGVIILIRLLGKEVEARQMQSLPCRFSDVPEWARGYANYADTENISKGISETQYGTNGIMTANQFNTLLLRTLGFDDGQGDFEWNKAVNKANQLGILPEDLTKHYNRGSDYTKRDLIETSFCFLEAAFKDESMTLVEQLIENGTVPEQLAEKYGLAVNGWDHLSTGMNQNDSLDFRAEGNELILSGTSNDENQIWLLVRVIDAETELVRAEEVDQKNSSDQYDIKLKLSGLPEGKYYVDVYANNQRYHYYSSVILSSVVLEKTEDGLHFPASPVYGQNLRLFLGNQLNAQDYKMTAGTSSDPDSIDRISALAKEITNGINGDYEKVQAVHDWVAEEIYYDKDFLKGKTSTSNIRSISVLNNKYAVCSGYSNLTRDLLAALGIPGRQVYGYGLGITGKEDWDDLELTDLQANHVWNEAYVDGRWIILDTTWDSANKYEDGAFTKGEGPSRLFFDVSVPFFSNTHITTINE